MEKIKSFQVNHDKLKKGLYISRIDDDIVTYDIRMKEPNKGDYIETPAGHTIEHLFATYVRNNQKYSQNIIYVGPMGCRTGFYFIVRDKISNQEVLDLLKDTFKFITEYVGEIPGATRIECGNYKEHDLIGAKKLAKEVFEILSNWSTEKMNYDE